MAGPPVAPPIAPPAPGATPAPPAPPVPAPAPAASGAAPVFVAATGDRHMLYDAFYRDERNTLIAKSSHPVKSFYDMHTGFNGAPSYANAVPMTWWKSFTNPLRDPAVATVLLQDFKDLKTNSASTKQHFEEARPYYVFAPVKLRDAYKAKAKAKPEDRPKAKVALFFGVEPEINLFGLRNFFAATSECVLITIPGVEEGWPGYGRAWGIGITTGMIKELLEAASLKD